MSGIAGIVNLDLAPVDPAVLARMVDAIRFRGPDAVNAWTEGPAGLGHTLLTTDDGEVVPQPYSPDGVRWIVADARIDARADLVAALAAADGRASTSARIPLASASDLDLILRAYDTWGEACAEHLLGDFAFAIWDAPARRLFCARDQMGVKPFFYAHAGRAFVFSNTLDAVRRHPAVSARLDELAIADFLLFDVNTDAGSSMFADIRRLAPGHTAVCSADGVRVRRYWTLPIDEPLEYRRQQDYVERFNELLHAAVSEIGRAHV